MKTNLLTTPAQVHEYLSGVSSLVAFDVETTSLKRDALLLGIAFYDGKRPPVFCPTDYFFNGSPVDALRPVLSRHVSRLRGLAHNAKFDLGVLKANGLPDMALEADTSLMVHLHDPNLLKSLKERARKDLGMDLKSYEEIIGKKWSKINWEADTASGLITAKGMGEYAGKDVVATWRLYHHYLPLLDEKQLRVLREIENPLCYVLRDMRDWGVQIDLSVLDNLSKRIEPALEALQDEIYQTAGCVFNLNSPKQKAEVLFDKLGLPVVGHTDTGARSTDKHALEELAAEGYPIAKLLQEHSALSTLNNSFIRAIPQLVDADGKLRCDFNSDGARTGRMSSSGPNLQNQPNNKRFPVRQAYVASPGYKLVVVDYSQIELRVMAHCSRDKRFAEAFFTGKDIHQAVADDLGVTREQAKTLNFGILYGMGAQKLSFSLGITEKQAQKIINGYSDTYQDFARWKGETERFAEKNKYVRNLFGRIRRLPDAARTSERGAYYGALRQAVNTVIQGAAADLMKLAMVALHQEYPRRGLDARMLLTVHDEFVIEAREDQATEIFDVTRHVMEHNVELRVPLLAEGKICENWFQNKDKTYPGWTPAINPYLLFLT